MRIDKTFVFDRAVVSHGGASIKQLDEGWQRCNIVMGFRKRVFVMSQPSLSGVAATSSIPFVRAVLGNITLGMKVVSRSWRLCAVATS